MTEKRCNMLDFASAKGSLKKINSEAGILLSCFRSIKESLDSGLGQGLSASEKETLRRAVLPLQASVCAIRSQMSDAFNIIVTLKNGGDKDKL